MKQEQLIPRRTEHKSDFLG